MNMKENTCGKVEEAEKRDVLDEGQSGVAAQVFPEQQHGMVCEHAVLPAGLREEEGVAPGPQEDKEVYAGLGTRVVRQAPVRSAVGACIYACGAGGGIVHAIQGIIDSDMGRIMYGAIGAAVLIALAAYHLYCRSDVVIHCE